MSDFGQRVREARTRAGITQKQLAQSAKLSQATISDIERGRNQGSGELLAIARALQCDPEWLKNGRIETARPEAASQPPPARLDNNVEPAQSPGRLVPLISWVRAGQLCDAGNVLDAGDAEDWIPADARAGPNGYALRVRGLSMFNPNRRPSFEDGDIIICNPDADARNLSLVIVRVGSETTFKRLLREEGEPAALEALNPSWINRIAPMPSDGQVCAVVVGRYERFA